MDHLREVDEALRQWSRTHHGLISVAEGSRLGASYKTLRGKVTRGECDCPFPNVYRSTAAPRTAHQALRAACLATGGVASHASAAWLWGLLQEVPFPIEVSVPRRIRRTSQGIEVAIHRSRDLHPGVTTTRDAVTVTKPLRTLVDLAATGTDDQLSEALDAALVKRLVTVDGLLAELARLSKPGRTGVGRLRKHLADQGFIGAPPASVLEARAWRLVRKIGIALPVVQVVAGNGCRYRLDLGWKEIKFAVEVDGYTWHFSPQQKQRDELRRQRLREEGWTLLVFDWRQITHQQVWVANEIRATYDRLAGPGR